MDGATLQSRLWRGYGKAALRIGTSHGVYRPSSTTNPLVSGNLVATIPAVFAIHAAQYTFDKPSDFKDNLFHGLFDATNVNQWDYLSGPSPGVSSVDGIYFVTGFDPLKPILCVQCTRVFALSRTSTSTAGGFAVRPIDLSSMPAQFGSASGSSSSLFTGYPGGIIMRRILTEIDKGFPVGTGAGIYEVLLPIVTGVLPQPWDVLTDDLGRGYFIRTCEVSDLGWRMLVAEEPTLAIAIGGGTGAAGSFMYPRTIDVHRPKVQAMASGPNVATLKPYTGTTTDTISMTGESVIFTGLPAGIQLISPLSRGAGSNLPSDTHAPGAYTIFIPAASASLGTIHNRDIIIDDQANRYQVEDAYYTNFGYNLRARLLEV